jgi:hypothetical protein
VSGLHAKGVNFIVKMENIRLFTVRYISFIAIAIVILMMTLVRNNKDDGDDDLS